MEQTTTTTQPTNNDAKRPVFLTVLCILSFIAAGLGILGYITAITAMSVVSSIDTTGMAGMEGTYTGPSAGLTWAYVIVGFITTLLSLYGVIKMWKLQKVGFYIYVAAAVISVIMGIIYSGFGVMGAVFPILFIVLYGLNLKAMK
jgi:hypothetical protein